MSTTPQISVILPTHNDERYLGSAIDSILAQTYKDFELIIVNDGSTDATSSIVDEFAKRDSRIVPLHQKNSGIVSALNHGLSIAKGEFIARMDGDDISLPDRFAKQIDYLKSNTHVVAVGTGLSFIDEQSNIIRLRGPLRKVARFVINRLRGTKPNPSSPSNLVAPSTLYGPQPNAAWICHPSAMIRKSAIDKVQGYRYFNHAEDTDLWMRLEAIGEIHEIQENLFQWRRHKDRVSTIHTQTQLKWHSLAFISARRRAEGIDDLDLTRAQSTDEIMEQLSDYEKDRYRAIFHHLNFRVTTGVDGQSSPIEAAKRLIDAYSNNPSSGRHFIPNIKAPKKVAFHPHQHIQEFIRYQHPRRPITDHFAKIYLRLVILPKLDIYQKIRRITFPEVTAIKRQSIAALEETFDQSANNFDFASYHTGNHWSTEPIKSVRMLQQTINIVAQAKMVYVECSKNACTTIKHALNLIEHLHHGYLPLPGAHHTKAENAFLGADDFSEKSFSGILKSEEFFKFCVSRDPYDRLVSAFRNKIEGVESLDRDEKDLYRDVINDILRTTRDTSKLTDQQSDNLPVSFDEFVNFITQQDPYQHDRHWLSQYTTMRPDLIDYDFIAKFESLHSDLMKICDITSQSEEARQALAIHLNQSNWGASWKSYYTEELANKVYTLYAKDFETFGYSADSWREA